MDHISQQTSVVVRRRSRSEALRLAIEFEQSGLTRRAFSRQHGISLASLDNYRKLHGGHSEAGPSSAADLELVPVELVDSIFPSQLPGSDASLYLVLSKGRRISIPTGFDAATLVRLIAVLDAA
jgi:hypothetical protein